MQLSINEVEQEHLYICLKEGQKAFSKQKKGAEALGLETNAIEELLDVNRGLRQQLNPRAEEEAREAARKRRGDRTDPRQLEIPVEVGGRRAERADASPNGKHSKKVRGRRISTATVVDGMDVANPDATQEPTDELLSRRLWEVCGLTVGVDVLHKWTSSEREAADRYIAGVHARTAAITAGQEGGAPPEPPHVVWNQMWRRTYDFNPRGSQLMIHAPPKEREYWADQGPFTIRKDGTGSQSKFFIGGILEGELQELEITDKLGLSRFKDAAIVRSAELNRQYHSRLLVGGSKFAADWVTHGMKHPGHGARYVAPVQPNAAEAR